jgi:RNA polymerase sigma-70 factor (ECF subfamily)
MTEPSASAIDSFDTRPGAASAGSCEPDGHDDQVLVQRIREGDPGAENSLILRFMPGLRIVLEHRLRNRELARHLAHESLMLVMEKLRLAGIEDATQLTAFIHRIALNLCQRGQRAEPGVFTGSVASGDPGGDGLDGPDAIAQRASQIERARKLMRVFRGSRDRELLIGWYVAGESRSALCARLGVSEAHFERVIYRARLRFRELTGDNGSSTRF